MFKYTLIIATVFFKRHLVVLSIIETTNRNRTDYFTLQGVKYKNFALSIKV